MKFAVSCEISVDGRAWCTKYFIVLASSASNAHKVASDINKSKGFISRHIKAVLEL